jgi:cytochrome bd-type quinol oxidase subunit 2
MKKLKFLVFIILAAPAIVLAADDTGILNRMGTVATNGGYVEGVDDKSMTGVIGTAISVILGLLGIIFVILFIYAGYTWMMAQGDKANIDKAKDTMWRAVIGLIIVVGAYAIWAYVFSRLL